MGSIVKMNFEKKNEAEILDWKRNLGLKTEIFFKYEN